MLGERHWRNEQQKLLERQEKTANWVRGADKGPIEEGQEADLETEGIR